MFFKYFMLSCVVGLALNQARCVVADDDTVTVGVVYTWKNAAHKARHAPDPGPVRESQEEAEQEGRKMVSDGRAYSFFVKQEQHKITRRYKSKRPFEDSSPDNSGGFGGTIVQPSPGNLIPESAAREPEKAPIRKPAPPFVTPQPYNPPVDIVGSWTGTYRSSKGVPFITTLRFAADGSVTSATPSGKGGRGTWRRNGNTVQITWRNGATTTWTVRGNQLSMSNVDGGFSESAQLERQ